MKPHRFTNAARQARRHAERRALEQAIKGGIVDRWRDFVTPLESEPPAAAVDDRAQLLLDERDRLRRMAAG